MSAKNRLQEYFQKRNLTLPEYTYESCFEDDKSPLWKSKVEVWIPFHKNGDTEFYEFLSGECVSKKEASKKAAMLALEEIEKIEQRLKKLKFLDKIKLKEDSTHTFIFLDLENVPNSFMETCEHINLSGRKDIHLIGFTNKDSEHIRKKVTSESEYYGQSIHLAKVLSSGKDAADIAICFFIGQILGATQTLLKHEKECDDKITFKMQSLSFDIETTKPCHLRFIICTKDHFGKTLQELINSFDDENYSAKNVSSIFDIKE